MCLKNQLPTDRSEDLIPFIKRVRTPRRTKPAMCCQPDQTAIKKLIQRGDPLFPMIHAFNRFQPVMRSVRLVK